MPGRLIAGRYRLDAVIGRGGMGIVWQACDELLSRDVAVKELVWPAYFSETERQAACRRATREAQLAAQLNHRNVIRIFDIAEEDGCPWIVMELVAYRSLRDLIKEEGPLSPPRAAEVGLEILAALRAAHEAGIAHRDVKPANILMAPDRVVLTDFGIAQTAGTSALTTAIGVLIGSPSYMAPERARGGRSGAPGDLWGLGATLYAAVEGHGPFDRDGGALASLTAVVADELAPATHAGPLWPVINGLLRKNPDERLDAATAERLLRGISTTYVARVRPATPVSPGVPVAAVAPGPRIPRRRAPRPRRSRGPVIALVGPAALAVMAVSGAAVGLTLASSTPRSRTVSAAASTRAPTAAPHPSTIASASPKTSTTTHLTAHTSRVHTSRAHPARSSAPRHASATTRSRTRKAGKATVRPGWLAIRVGTFIFRIPDPEWRFHPLRGHHEHR